MADIYVDGKLVASCADYLSECPEDAIWCRDLEDIFNAGVKVGRLTKDDSEFEIKNISDPY